ncbi:MAG TPA: hypothetical protein VLV49_07260 [Terriglobales bacterium]|nr:hypothetical protein [Terriglobales bacterium]
MPEESANAQNLAPAGQPGPQPAPGLNLGPGPGINIGEEYGTAKKNLPPAKVVLIVLGVVLIVVGVYSFLNRAKPQGAGSLDSVAAAEVPNQNEILVALTLTLRNTGRKTLWVRDVKGTLNAGGKEYTDTGASAMDFDRYFQAFPVLKQGSQPALMPETKLQPGQEIKGTILVSFPVTQQAFDQRQSVSAVIQPYDQPVPIVLRK